MGGDSGGLQGRSSGWTGPIWPEVPCRVEVRRLDLMQMTLRQHAKGLCDRTARRVPSATHLHSGGQPLAFARGTLAWYHTEPDTSLQSLSAGIRHLMT